MKRFNLKININNRFKKIVFWFGGKIKNEEKKSGKLVYF